jgi:hypothetical protein
MTILLNCSGCGRRLKVPAALSGKKTRCPACRAVCAVPAAPVEAVVDVTDALAAEPETIGFAPEDKPADPRLCPLCRAERRETRRGGRTVLVCPRCEGGAPAPLPTPAAAVRPAAGKRASAPTPAVTPAPAGADDACPGCATPMNRDAVVCLECGFNRKTGKQLKTVSKRLQQTFESGASLITRIVVFGIGFVLLGLIVFALRDDPVWLALLGPALVFWALLLGTFKQLTVTRDTTGQPLLVTRWFVCFIPCPTLTTDLEPYGTIRLKHEEGGGSWLAFGIIVFLLLMGAIPGIIYWIFLFRGGSSFSLEIAGVPDSYGVSHVEPLLLFRGRSERQMRALADALERIAGMRFG